MALSLSSVSRRAAAFVGGGLIAASLAVGGASASQAAASHYNTDPYATGCADSARVIATKTVSGGTATIKRSNVCGTNWIEYRGIAQTTYKRGYDSGTGKYTQMEIDKGGYAYSMQSFAPYPTKFTGVISINGTTWAGSCTGETCSWTVTGGSSTPAPSTTLSAKVDAFVAKYNGKYVDFDGYYGAQCADLAQQYAREVVGASRFSSPVTGGAQDYWTHYDTSKFTRVSAGSTPRKGDVAVWRGAEWNSPKYGHVAIVLADNGSSIKVLSQNPGATKITTITKSDLLGYLRPVG
ncbi:CHAP domain-containing protein [Brachybacterium sp. EF45031]|uniref:CHAP domain-containing protein n=1 Tax=Brachybacterium sillae TaxID=2810536 RepID=UPI00217E8E8F|nr:CHAP domain-containing protein [Brachybacterium sillae]MCS6710772.1 CHAP domain-containing protein [Brachybacterium sillae]